MRIEIGNSEYSNPRTDLTAALIRSVALQSGPAEKL
jgi:hypothetical protein